MPIIVASIASVTIVYASFMLYTPLVCLCFAHGIAFNRYASKLLPYSRDSKPHAVKLYAVTAPRLLLYYASLHQIARWNFAQNSSYFVGLLCTIFYTIYILL